MNFKGIKKHCNWRKFNHRTTDDKNLEPRKKDEGIILDIKTIITMQILDRTCSKIDIERNSARCLLHIFFDIDKRTVD